MVRSRKTRYAVIIILASVAGVTMAAHAVSWSGVPGPESKVPVFELPVDSEGEARIAITTYCGSCHQRGRSGIDFDDEHLTLESMRQDRVAWKIVVRRLQKHEMPPRKSPQPTENERRAMIAWIEREVLDKTTENLDGNLMARRLDRSEYVNVMRDLVGVRFQPPQGFPKDANGWTRCDDVPEIPAGQLAMYRSAAWQLLDQAFAAKVVPVSTEEEPAEQRRRGRRPVLDLQQVAESDEADGVKRARGILQRFTDRAYRKPADADEINRLLAVFQRADQEGKSFDDSLKAALVEVLTSPRFLLHVERRGGADGDRSADQFALASRLAFFLWRTGPDDELLDLAKLGTLEENLEAQVKRMVKARSPRALAKDFANSWLSLSLLDTAYVLDEPLRQAMRLETEKFVEGIVCDDRSVLEFIDADYTFVNERLAEHYGMAGVKGTQMRRVSVGQLPRGGLVGQAAMMRLSSSDLRTSPVNRGKWVLETLLGAAPIRPPAGILQALEETSSKSERAPLSKQLETHRNNPSCAQCHHKMDAIGLSLESFDAFGAFQSDRVELPVDVTSTLPDGEVLDGVHSLKRYLLKHREQFVRAFGERLLRFALGRNLTDEDRAGLSHLPAAVVADQDRFSRILMQVVLSESFRRGFTANK